MKDKFDLIVIGAGSGGLNIASFMNRAGFKVLLVDKKEENIGGDCLNFGCVPSKALIHIARIIHTSKKAVDFGFQINGETDMKKVADYISSKKNHIRLHENKEYFESIGMTVVLGEAKFFGKNSIKVNNTIYHAKKIILATGSRPRKIPIEGIEEANILTNESIFDLLKLPKKLLIVGGGPIGIEIGQAFRYLGSEVSIVIKENRILSREDEAISKVLEHRMEEEGIKFYFESNITKVLDKTKAIVNTSEGQITLEFDKILVAIGRELNYENLDLEKALIELNEKKSIKVNAYLETTNKNVLLCGDIVGAHQFTHAAELHAGVIIKNFFVPSFLSFFKKKLVTSHMSSVTFTNPELATFGLSQRDLKDKRISYKVLEESFEEDDRAIIEEKTYGKVKLFVSPKGILFGGSMVAENAGELIQELILVQTNHMNVSSLFSKIYPYPTATRINKRVISNLYKEKLTSFVKKIMKILY